MGKAEIAKKIRDARISKGLTQADVAQKLGITPQAVSNFERGKNRISNDILRSMCEIYGISADLVLDNAYPTKHKFDISEFAKSLSSQQKESNSGFNIAKIIEWEQSSEAEAYYAIVKYLKQLNEDGQEEAVKRIAELSEIPRYQRKSEK